MKNNWVLHMTTLGSENLEDDFDDYGSGDSHSVSIGDEIEASDRDGNIHAGVVVGIIRDVNGAPVCYKIWDGEQDMFDYVQSSSGILCEPCGSSQWALGRIGYKRYTRSNGHDFYHNGKTGDVIDW